MFSLLGRVHDRITRAGFLMGGATLCGIVLCFWLEVVARYFFNSPTLWSGSMVAYLLCLSISLATPELARSHGHIAITVLPERLKGSTRRLYDRIIAVLTGSVCSIAGWICVQETTRQFNYHTTTAMGLDIPKYWVSAFIAYGLVSASIHFFRHGLSRTSPLATTDHIRCAQASDKTKGP